MRIASLLPSATEIVCALGARGDLVGISHECDFPEGLSGVPVLTRPRLRPARSSREIDAAVRDVLRDALAVYDIDLDALREARPDVIVTQDLCDVCAVSLDDVRAAVARLARHDVHIVNLRPARLDDIWADVRRVAEGIGRAAEGDALAERLRARVAGVAARAAAAPDRPRVLAVEWLDPVMIGGVWMPELIALAGGEPLVTRPGDHAPTLSLADLAALDPDVVLIKPCGFALERTLAEVDLLPRVLPWSSYRAVAQGRVFLADGNAFFNRPGPRIVESLEILAACVHPGPFADARRAHARSVVRLDAALERHVFDEG
ncbi:ABC transporter substrate-binding protein [Sorangium cellulosum]|uniref:ABC transporter substrate-binding protein n=1 Tax=Sorangium cellulosum TaxID=56 RepID=A0A2L0F6X8_SORCE|nr:ABC transporter substrate-binding protein [Sorangium cellulosum]AUX47282.1 ABC transporter substrate-binding protein [Sorangium cellulosum]